MKGFLIAERLLLLVLFGILAIERGEMAGLTILTIIFAAMASSQAVVLFALLTKD